MRARAVLVVLALASVAPAANRAGAEGADGPAPLRHVVMVSIDGLMPAAIARPDELGLKVPNLRRLAREGAFATGVVGVLPTVTYPSHTTLLTGVPPAVHGIYGNTLLDPAGRSNDAWYWYTRDIRIPTLASAVRERGGTLGSVFWPVSVGLPAERIVPEFWRSGSEHPSDLELLRVLSTPGLFEAAEKLRGAPVDIPVSDAERTDFALAILREIRPTLLLLHLGDVDHEEHAYGPGAPEVAVAIEEADRQVGRLRAALDELGIAGSTLVAVVSDHGFVKVTKLLRPNTLLVENGLVALDDKGKVKSWKAWFHSHGGTASLHLADPDDAATRAKVRELLAAKLREPGSGIAALLEKGEVSALGGDPRAELFVDAADGFAISRTPTGGWLGDATDRGYHGYDPRREAMRASLALAAPGLARRGDLGIVSMTRIAPTLAEFLGVELSPEAAAPLPIFEPAKVR